MQSRINVLHLRDSPWFDGPGRTIVETGLRMDSAEFNYYVAGFVGPGQTSNPFLEEASRRGCKVLTIQEHSRFDPNALRKLREIVEDLEIDILHAHEFRSNLYTLFCRTKKPIVRLTTIHGWIRNSLKEHIFVFLDKLLLHLFDGVVAVSERIKKDLRFFSVPKKRIHVIHNALMLNDFNSDEEDTSFRREISVDKDTVVLVNIGRLSREKGQDIFLKAGRILRDRGYAVRLAFLGIGPEEEYLRKLAIELDMEDTSFCGFKKNMLPIYAGADYVVQSSLTEGLPNVILESLWTGVPTVATAVGGTPEIVEHGVSGLLVPPGDPLAIADSLESLITNLEYREQLVSSGRKRILLEFDIDVRVKRISSLYKEVV